MHEVGICEGVLGAVERRAAGRAVTRVRVRVGRDLLVDERSFADAFALLAEGSVAAAAAVDVVVVGGEELVLESLEYGA